MRYEALKKLAFCGTVEVEPHENHICPKGQIGTRIAEFRGVLPERTATAALFCHCRNHFDEVVEALEAVCDETQSSHQWKHTLAKCKEVLARAKEVK